MVLAILLLEAGRAVSTERFVDELWGEHPPPSATTVVQGYVWRLRRLSADRLITRGRGYELLIAEDELDTKVFENLVDSGVRGLAAMPLI